MTDRVHVVFTGGTIGSSVSGTSTGLDATSSRQILAHLDRAGVVLSESEPYQILSEDAGVAHWAALAAHIAALDVSGLDAIVVAHGSDTLDFTAHALAYALLGVPKPIVLIGADLPLSDPDSNGFDNFRDAVTFALSERLPGVYVAWKNRGEATNLHLATRILPCDIHDDTFRSAKGLHFGAVSGGEFRRNAVEGNPSRSHLAKSADPFLWSRSREWSQLPTLFDPAVLVLPAQPGLYLSNPTTPVLKAVVQLAYHSGTAPSLEGNSGLLELAHTCRAAHLPLVVGPCRHGREPYSSVERLRAAGVWFAPSTTATSLVVKTRWLLGTGQDLNGLAHDIAFDRLPETTFRG